MAHVTLVMHLILSNCLHICPTSGALNQEKSKAEKEYFEKVVEEGEPLIFNNHQSYVHCCTLNLISCDFLPHSHCVYLTAATNAPFAGETKLESPLQTVLQSK